MVKLPFADVKRLAAAAQQDSQDERELTAEEEVCMTCTKAFLLLTTPCDPAFVFIGNTRLCPFTELPSRAEMICIWWEEH